MYIEERHRAILEWLSQHGSISNTDIQKNFDVSYDSAKRDLRILEEKGLLKRTHGGALPIRQIAAGRPETMTFKDIPQVKPNYLQIAKEAVSLIQENDVIYIPSTTLGLFMVKNLPEHLKIKVVTNSILIADELRTLTMYPLLFLAEKWIIKETAVILSLLKPLKGSVLTNASLPLLVSLHPLDYLYKVRLI